MLSNLPTARQVDWISAIPHITIMGLMMYGYFLADSEGFILYGALTYLVLSYSLKNFVPLDHKVGMRLVHKKEFQNITVRHNYSLGDFICQTVGNTTFQFSFVKQGVYFFAWVVVYHVAYYFGFALPYRFQ